MQARRVRGQVNHQQNKAKGTDTPPAKKAKGTDKPPAKKARLNLSVSDFCFGSFGGSFVTGASLLFVMEVGSPPPILKKHPSPKIQMTPEEPADGQPWYTYPNTQDKTLPPIPANVDISFCSSSCSDS